MAQGVAAQVELVACACPGLSGSDLCEVVRRAALLPIREAVDAERAQPQPCAAPPQEGAAAVPQGGAAAVAAAAPPAVVTVRPITLNDLQQALAAFVATH